MVFSTNCFKSTFNFAGEAIENTSISDFLELETGKTQILRLQKELSDLRSLYQEEVKANKDLQETVQKLKIKLADSVLANLTRSQGIFATFFLVG